MNFPSIRIEGAILSPDIFDRLDDAVGQQPADFGLESSPKVKDEIARAWADAQDYWRIFQRKLDSLKAESPATTETRNNWIVPLLGLLGYQLEYQARGTELNGKNYPLSHRVTNRGQTPVHIIGCREPAGLDRKPEKSALRMSSHAMVQEYLNLTDQLYGLATNGRVLRLLRDSSRLIKLSYLEFDLDRIFADGLFADFAMLYRLLHASRLPSSADAASSCWLERYHQDTIEQGTRIRDGLRAAVTEALELLGTGFIAHPDNGELRQQIETKQLAPEDFFKHILRLVYRQLFLMVIEERGLVFPKGTPTKQINIYFQHYSVQRLRRLALTRGLKIERFHDAWLSLLATFRLFEQQETAAKLGMSALGGMLFDPQALGPLASCRLSNASLFAALDRLCNFNHPKTGQRMPVNFGALATEEFGSVYESLLELHPIVEAGPSPRFGFKQAAGNERKTTGSYYTPTSLVDCLLDSALDPVLDEAEKGSMVLGFEGAMPKTLEPTHPKTIGEKHGQQADQVVPRSHRLAASDGVGQAGLFADQIIPEGRDLRPDQPDAQSGRVGSGEHRGGERSRNEKGLPTVPADRSGESSRSGDVSVATARHQSGDDATNATVAHSTGVGQQTAASADRIPRTLKPQHPSTAEQRILALKVCDPACGSGHFLIAAAQRIARRLARVRSGDDEPSPQVMRAALRDVISHCIYGVDINPMSVELCKVALWMEAMEPGKPLSFLDHHIQCGNSLLGTTPALLAQGIPDDAFTPIEGDVKARVTEFKKQNKKERAEHQKGQGYLFEPFFKLGNIAADFARLNTAPDGTLAEVAALQEQYARLVNSSDYESTRLLADTWCAAFVWKKDDSADGKMCPTERDFRKVESHAGAGLLPHVRAEVERLRDQYQFFHWHLAFPDVFRLPGKDEPPENEQTGWSGGFDVVLGNPPWEHTELKEKEWFAERRPDITEAANDAARKRMIAKLRETDPALFDLFRDAIRNADGVSHFVRNSSRFPLCGRGRINTYTLFAELNRDVTSVLGGVGCIVPSGIATDDNTKDFFSELMRSRTLVSLFSFDNKEGLFPAVKRSYRFCLLTLTGASRPMREAPQFVFYAGLVEHLDDVARRFTLSLEDVAKLNPNTQTCPVFRSRRDADLTATIYRRVPVLWKEQPVADNPWGISFKQGLFNMAADSGLFRTSEQLAAEGWTRDGNIFLKGNGKYLPLYEGKMLDAFDHRSASYFGEGTCELTVGEKLDPAMFSLPRYWVLAEDVENQLRGCWDKGWLLGWQNVTDVNTMARTVKFTVFPRVGVGHSFPVMFPTGVPSKVAMIFANFTTFVLDYVARQKIGGVNLTYQYLKQFAVLPPDTYSHPCPWVGPLQSAITHQQFLLPRVLELTYTAWDLEPFARDCGYAGPPFRWDEARRFLLRAELDAAFFHLYGLNRDDTDYILDTFPIVRRKDIAQHGTYRTKDTILEIYDAMQEATRTGQPYQTRLDPPPADPRVAHPPRETT